MPNLNCTYLFVFAFCIACQPNSSNTDQEMNTETQQLLNKVISQAGGIKAYQALNAYKYKKEFDLLDSLGNIEKSYQQTHEYQIDKSYYKLTSIESGDTIVSIQNGNTFTRTINGQQSTADAKSIKKSIYSGLYAIQSPFNLLDQNVRLKNLGTSIENKDTFHILEARYNADLYTNHSSSEPWRYYVNNEGVITHCWVKSSHHFNLVYNLNYERFEGVQKHHKRESYRIDSLGNKLYLRARYKYYDYQLLQ